MAFLGNHQGENGQSSEDESWIDEYGLSLDNVSGIPDTLIPDIGLLHSPAIPIHDAARARLCPLNLTALTGGAFPAETTPKEATEPLPGVVPAPQPLASEREGYFAPAAHGRYAENQTPGRVPEWVTDDLLERCSTTEGDLHLCIHPTHEKPHVFPTQRDLKKHLRSHIPDEHLPHRCLQRRCGRGFLYRKDFERHLKAHAGSCVECPHCHEKLSRSDNLARHMRKRHPNITFPQVIEALNESLGEGSVLPAVLPAASDKKASKSRRSKKPRMGTPDAIFAGKAWDGESNIDPVLRGVQHLSSNMTARSSFASASSHTDTASAIDMPTTARIKEDDGKHLRRQEPEGSSSNSGLSQTQESTRSMRPHKSRRATLTAPSSVGSGSSERKHFDKGSDTVARRNPKSRTKVALALDGK